MTTATLSNGVSFANPLVNGDDTPTRRSTNVLKFGGQSWLEPRLQPTTNTVPGTSVGKFPQDIVNVVKSSSLENDVAIVCSAV